MGKCGRLIYYKSREVNILLGILILYLGLQEVYYIIIYNLVLVVNYKMANI